uniref:Endonuclease/exonuclease/phosphatase n=1 Tax=Solanum tuberosum TaxID=4113 RepID=M1CX15_SOLTU
MVLGDFNSLLKTDDRIGGNPVVWAEIMEFNECVLECGLIEFPTHGSRYTWSDKHDGNKKFSKIDWIFINREWLDAMPTCKALFLPEGINC